MTGEMGRSFVVGYGSDGGPRFIHHRASSCAGFGGSACNWDTYWADSPNGEALIGALVGGPNGEEEFKDSRLNYIQNLVSIEYNAGGSHSCCCSLAAPRPPGAARQRSSACRRAPVALPTRAQSRAGSAARMGARGPSSPLTPARAASQASPA